MVLQSQLGLSSNSILQPHTGSQPHPGPSLLPPAPPAATGPGWILKRVSSLITSSPLIHSLDSVPRGHSAGLSSQGPLKLLLQSSLTTFMLPVPLLSSSRVIFQQYFTPLFALLPEGCPPLVSRAPCFLVPSPQTSWELPVRHRWALGLCPQLVPSPSGLSQVRSPTLAASVPSNCKWLAPDRYC